MPSQHNLDAAKDDINLHAAHLHLQKKKEGESV
jgi:hypothetical protein